jgi:hypothetical protein
MNEGTITRPATLTHSNEEAAGIAKAREIPWQHYPHLDAAILTETPAVLAGIGKTCRELNRLLQAGTEREKERARVALVAYGKALELYHHLTELRDEALQTASNIRGRIAINE